MANEVGRFVMSDSIIHDTQNTHGVCPGIPMNDLGALRCWTASEVMEARGRTIFRWKDHLLRLRNSAKDALINLSKIDIVARNVLEKRLQDLLELNCFEESIIHLHCTAGQTLNGWTPIGKPKAYAEVFKLVRKKTPARLKTVEFKRSLAHIKRPEYFLGAVERYKVSHEMLHNDILYVDPETDYILEGTGSNVCLIFSGTGTKKSVVSPMLQDSSGNPVVLDGITLKVISEIVGSKEGWVFRRENFTKHLISEYFLKQGVLDGALFTSTTGVIHVECIDELHLPVGPATTELMDMFKKYRDEYYKNLC